MYEFMWKWGMSRCSSGVFSWFFGLGILLSFLDFFSFTLYLL